MTTIVIGSDSETRGDSMIQFWGSIVNSEQGDLLQILSCNVPTVDSPVRLHIIQLELDVFASWTCELTRYLGASKIRVLPGTRCDNCVSLFFAIGAALNLPRLCSGDWNALGVALESSDKILIFQDSDNILSGPRCGADDMRQFLSMFSLRRSAPTILHVEDPETFGMFQEMLLEFKQPSNQIDVSLEKTVPYDFKHLRVRK